MGPSWKEWLTSRAVEDETATGTRKKREKGIRVAELGGETVGIINDFYFSLSVHTPPPSFGSISHFRYIHHICWVGR
jgi:hypothetical protein